MCPDPGKKKIITEHYNDVAKTYGDSSASTMEDQIIREREVTLISNFLKMLESEYQRSEFAVLDVGCGNGFTLKVLRDQFKDYKFYGIDLTKELIKIAKDKNAKSIFFQVGDVKKMPYEDHQFDLIYSERCLINILGWDEQIKALNEIARILKPGGYYLMIEAFSDGLDNNNRARQELGMDEIKVAFHNLYFNKEIFLNFVKTHNSLSIKDPSDFELNKNGELFQTNFLSSHYFFARVFHPLVTHGDRNKKNTEFVKFFSHLPPFGNYSPIQAYILRKN